MKNLSLVYFSLILFSLNCFAQNTLPSELADLRELKKGSVAGPNLEHRLQDIYMKAVFPNLKSTQDDYGDPPEWGLVNTYGGSGKDIARKVAMAADGSFFVTGSFSGEMSIESDEYASTGKRDAFLAKFHGNGSLIWFRQFSPMAGNSIDAYGIHLDDIGKIYVTGYYTGNVSIGDFVLPNANEMNLFVLVADNNGEIIWAMNHQTYNNTEVGLKVDTDDNGNVFVLGSTNTSIINWHPSVIIKYGTDGTLLTEYYNDKNFCDMKIVANNIYFIGDIDLPDYIGDIYVEPTGLMDVFIAKSNTDLDFEWAEIPGHTSSGYVSSKGISMYVTANEDIFICGKFVTNLVWGQSELIGGGGFVARCSSEGDFLWAEKISEIDYTPIDITGNSENIFVGYYLESWNSLQTYQIKTYSLSGTPGLIADFEEKTGSITYNANNGSLITTNEGGLVKISGLDEANLSIDWDILFDGNSAASQSLGMDIDQNGFIYNFGFTSNHIDYFNQTINKGLFLTKQSGTGIPIWTIEFGDAMQISNWIGKILIVDTISNSIYIAGSFLKPLVVPNGPTLTPDTLGSVYLLKYNFDGGFQWAIQEEIKGNRVLCLTYDTSGDVLLCSTFSGSINIGGTELTAEVQDIIIVKYSGSGEFVWVKQAGGESVQYIGLISTDGQNNVYLAGEFTSENVIVDDLPITLEEGDGNILFAKFDPQGNVLWATSKGGSTIEWGDYYAWPTGIITDNEGNSYIKGWHADSASFDNFLQISLFDNPGYNNKWNKFTAKFDMDGNTIWAKSMNELNDYGYDYNQFDIDQSGNVYSGLYVRDTVLFGDEFMYVPFGANDLLVINYTTDGELNWVKSMEDSETGFAKISSIAVYDEETAYVSGWFNDYLDFGINSFEVTNKTGFIGVLGEVLGTTEYQRNNVSLLFDLFPNPAHKEISILPSSFLQDDANLLISDVTGRNIYSVIIKQQIARSTIDISGFSPGVYFAKFQYGSQTEVKKFVVE